MIKRLMFAPRIFATAIAVMALNLAAAQGPAVAGPKAVLELFTSQGCSSCPPADKLLGKLSQSGDVLTLSMPVDYWDYLGWKDTLASPEHSLRQRAYARSRGDRAVYTPQVVINGRSHVVGSNAPAIDAQIKKELNQHNGLPVDLTLTMEHDTLRVKTGRAPDHYTGEGATLWLVYYNKSEKVRIARGENRGRTITYHNVVRKMQPIGMWKGKEIQIDLPRNEVMKVGVDSCAVLLQVDRSGKPGPIIGAASLVDLNS